MNEKRTTNDDAELSGLLHSWRVTEPLPPRFEERVWKLIEAAETRPVTGNWADRLKMLCARPAFATAVATLMLVAAVSAGLWQANRDTTRWDNALEQRYVASVDPYFGQR